jgi:Asp-tRNA(Asn)/Glu-tRNA(Gln) amidotransferase A subunit family amidase
LNGLDEIADLSDVRLGIYKAWFNDSDEKVRKRCYEVVDFLKSKGATVVEIEIPHLQAVAIAHGMKISTEFALSWDKVWGNAPESIEPNTLITLGIGTSATPVEILAGEKLRAWMFKHVTELFEKEKLTAIVNPTIGIEAPIVTEETKVVGESNTALSVRVMKYLAWVNFLGLPGYTVPVGYIDPSNLDPHEPKDTKLPVGFQFVGDHWSENQV